MRVVEVRKGGVGMIQGGETKVRDTVNVTVAVRRDKWSLSNFKQLPTNPNVTKANVF